MNPASTLGMLDAKKLAQFIVSVGKDRPLLDRRSDEEILSLTGIVKQGKLTLAGMITLGDYPQQIYPNLCVTAIAVKGRQLHEQESGECCADNKRYEGTVEEVLDGVMGFISRNGKTKVLIRNGRRVDVPEYPETAVREIVTNALMHRDYGPYCNGTPIRLVLFSDRLECWNPGGVYGGQSINELGYANMPTRNPTLVSILEIQKTAENRHSGIPIIRDEAKIYGVKAPEFIDQRDSFLVRFFSETDTQTVPGHNDEIGQRDRQRNNPENIENNILIYCATSRSSSEIAEYFGYEVGYLRRKYIRPMVAGGRLVMTMPHKPRSKFQRYRTATV